MARLPEAAPGEPFSTGTLNSQSLPIMRAVIHLWAADVAGMAAGPAFPCSIGEMENFVSRASRLREAAAAVRYRQSGARLIDGDAWEIALS